MTTPIYRLLPAVAAWWVVSRVTCANYDEFMTCGSGSERYGRHYRYNPNLPCDLSKDGFCDSPGTQYPWSAVRRFVYENQGLMKRMYGNQRHYNVLRSEIINEMFEEMLEEMPKRQHNRYQPPPPPPSTMSSSSSSPSQSPNTRTPRYHKNSNANSLKSKSWTKSSKTSGSVPSRHQKSLSMKVTAEPEYRQRTPASDPSTSPRPKAQSSSTGNRIRIKEATATTSSLESRGSSVATDIPVHKATRTNTRRPQSSTNFPSGEPLASSADTPSLTTENDWGSEGELVDGDFSPLEKMDEGGDGLEENVQSTYFPPPDLDEINIFEDEEFWTTLEDFDTTTPYSTPLDSVDFEHSYSTLPQQEMVTSTPAALESDVFLEDPEDEDYLKDFISSPSDEGDVTTLTAPEENVTDLNTEESDPENPDEMDMVFEESIAQEEIRQQEVAEGFSLGDHKAVAEADAVKDEEMVELEPEMREEISSGVVHKDVLEDFHQQEPEKETVKTKRPIRGMNACPVKEEFVAPYWANNTRGETLALLNFYPFEQYVQWERCMYEHRQMYCRKGCRCEQQYRLQKLLAFDPTNECRGIFSDWFRFPSCCVCKCYDLPQDLFTGSARRPRIQPDDYDEEDLYDDEDEVDLEDFGEDDYEDEDGNENDNIERSDDGEDEEIPLSTLSYRVRSQGGRYVNIPPQRRPRLPPRPVSHINLPHNYFAFKDKEASSSSSTPPSVTTSTLGTLDVSTPHYFFNISQFAQKLFGNAQPFPLSRIPRSNPEV